MAAIGVNMSKRSFVLTLTIYCLFQTTFGQVGLNDTTLAPIDNTTEALTTTPRPTTTTVTTTTIAPSGSGSNIPDSTDVSLCPCDLTGNGCDVNCCCDPDCSDADKLVFSECLLNQYTFDDKLCFDRDVFFSENGPARSGDSGNLFCVYFDNEEERNYYNNPSLITTEAEFSSYSAKTRTFSFQSPADPLTVSSFEPYYKSGDPIYTVFPNGYFSYLGLPTSMTASSACADSNPTAFYIDQSTACGRFLDNLANDCGTANFLRASTYFQDLRIVKDPFLLQVFNSTTTLVNPLLGPVDLTEVTDLYNNTYTAALQLELPLLCHINGITGSCSFTDVPTSPTYSSTTGTCTNALIGVHYRFETNGAFGIDQAYVRFTFSDITSSSVTQTFSTSFSLIVSASSAEPVLRSGNPGYDFGQPILAGVFNITNDGSSTVEEILLVQERGQQLALIRPSASGDCNTADSQPREPVLFGQDMRTGCLLTVNEQDNCLRLQQTIMSAVEGYAIPIYDPNFAVYPKNYRYVGMFGNSDNRKTGDWVEIFFKGRPGNDVFQGSECKLSLGANIQILYANIGALANPQAKIIGVSYVYDAPQTIRYQCTGALCQPGQASLSRTVEVSTSVTFIDLSDPPVGVEGQYPTVPIRLPYDFFYPFTDAASKQHAPSLLAWVDKEFGEEQYYRMRTRSNVPYKFKNLTDVGVDQSTLAQMSPHQSASELIPDNANEVSQCPSQRQLPYNRMPKRREHAPLRRYLPSELGLPEMYERFVDTGKMKMSYNTYLQGI
ncbi:hypothetical protein RRG08_034888 [Elysia crispata]|uniref:Tectonic domain-containing protein n=1 Tax=Elysia crispata TaxID=231223 RepID=A0AAE0ZSL9_9GAST|nr:hypothetical protein RRG08_034888 [Elysia crispata]